MGLPARRKAKLSGFFLFLMPCCAFAQTNASGQFSCGENGRASLNPTELKFSELASPDSIKQWKTRPVARFEAFDAAKYGFDQAEFYRWHVPVPGREGYDQGAIGESTDRLVLAVRLSSPRGERWFELAHTEDPNDGFLYIQQRFDGSQDTQQSESTQVAGASSRPDEMAAWVTVEPATPEAKVPLFMLSYWHKEGGVYQVVTFTNSLLVDLRSGSAKVSSTLSCSEFEPIGGACSAQDEANSGSDHVQCDWDAGAGDFRCAMTSPYATNSINAARTGQKDFYLFSGKPVRFAAEDAEIFSDLGQLALHIRDNRNPSKKSIQVNGLGPVTLLQRFKDLLPGAEVFVFASPGAGGVWSTHLSLVTVQVDGKPQVQSIAKWGISGEQTDETDAPKDFVPVAAQDIYRTHILEQRPGFRAFDAVLSGMPGRPDFAHVLYWIGIEAVDGKLVASAVRLASDGYAYGGCGQDYHEGSATAIRRKPGLAEATLRVQGQFEYEYTNPYPTEGPNCVWSSLLHWKPGAGFRARKLAEDCKLAHQVVTITEDGAVSGKDAQAP